MKKLLWLFIICLMIVSMLVLAACGGRSKEAPAEESVPEIVDSAPQTSPPTTPSLPPALPLPPTPPPPPIAPLFESLDFVAAAFARVKAIWDEDDGDLWGFPLHTPLLIADELTREAVANMPDSQGILKKHGELDVYVGVLPDDVLIFNTAVSFDNTKWSMMTWNLLASYDYDETWIVRVLVHEALHAVQSRIVAGGSSALNIEHMYNADARISVFMEINALFAALRATGGERLAAVNDALSVRAERRQNYPRGERVENTFEVLEGMAQFTEMILVFKETEVILDALYNDIVKGYYTHMMGGFGYTTGALYYMLLNEADSNWQQGSRLGIGNDLGGRLRQVLGINELTPYNQLDLEKYGYSRVAPGQTAWAENFVKIRAQGEVAMNEQPNLRLLGYGHFESGTADAVDAIFHIPLRGTVYYGSFAIVGPNFRLELRNGFVSFPFNPDGVRVGAAVDIVVDEGGMWAAAPTWALMVTDDDYVIKTLDDGLIEIVRR